MLEEEKVVKEPKYNPNAINEKIIEFVKFVHGSYISKQKVIDDFNKEFPDCSKKSIEKKMKTFLRATEGLLV